jgi:mannose-6-phosphate isomerase-like protein (cupin superfamily)
MPKQSKAKATAPSLEVHDLAMRGARLPLLEIGSPNSVDPAASWARLDEVNGVGVFVSHFSGLSPWEKHSADEFLYMVQGEAELTLLINAREVRRTLKQGCALSVPKNVRHRLKAPMPDILLSLTPT